MIHCVIQGVALCEEESMDNRVTKKQFILYILFAVMIPMAVSSLFLALYPLGHQSFFSIMPSWNDEDFYYNQVKSILQYGHPLGYYGYDGSHASVGNFGAHGWFILIPSIIFCGIFGLHFNSVAIMNHVLFSLVILLYGILFKPKLREYVLWSICIFSPMVLFYSNTWMMEGYNYFLALLAALIFAYVCKYEQSSNKVYVLLVFIVVIASFSKITWVALAFPAILILLEKYEIKLVWRYVISVVATIFWMIVTWVIYGLFSASYFPNSYNIDIYRQLIERKGLLHGIAEIIIDFIENVVATFSIYDFKWIDISKNYIVFILILSIVFIIVARNLTKGNYIPLFVIVGFIGGTILLYASEGYAIRTITSAALFACAYMVAVLPQSTLKYIILIGHIVFLIGTMYVQNNYGFDLRAWYVATDEEKYEDIEEALECIMVNENADTAWENTVIVPLDSYPDRIIELFLPAGVGINYYKTLPENIDELQAKYILMSQGNVSKIDVLEEAGYKIVEEIEGANVLERIR